MRLNKDQPHTTIHGKSHDGASYTQKGIRFNNQGEPVDPTAVLALAEKEVKEAQQNANDAMERANQAAIDANKMAREQGVELPPEEDRTQPLTFDEIDLVNEPVADPDINTTPDVAAGDLEDEDLEPVQDPVPAKGKGKSKR